MKWQRARDYAVHIISVRIACGIALGPAEPQEPKLLLPYLQTNRLTRRKFPREVLLDPPHPRFDWRMRRKQLI